MYRPTEAQQRARRIASVLKWCVAQDEPIVVILPEPVRAPAGTRLRSCA
jgi:hypothetical protein